VPFCPPEILDSGLLEVLLPVGMLNPIVKRLAFFPAEKHERIMEHARKTLQGFDDHLIHRHVPGFPGLGFLLNPRQSIPG